MAKNTKPKEVKEVKAECCLTCKYLLTCAEVAGAKCRNYERKEIDKEAISTRYLEILKQLTDLTNELVIIETEMKIVEEVGILPEQPEEKPALSARNKKIIALMEQGLSVEEIAKQLGLKIETVMKEIGYLTKIRALNNKTLQKKGNKVVVLQTA